MNRYSQNDEQDVILKFFEGLPPGRFLDIGAYDGVTYSNTRALLELGWSGVLVEPSPHSFLLLMENCKKFDRKTILILALASATYSLAPLMIEQTPGREWSTSANERMWRSGSIHQPHPCAILAGTAPLTKLATYGPFDFISIDAEGMDLMLLFRMPVDLIGPCKLICIEPHDDRERAEMKLLLVDMGFTVLHETPENLIAART